MLTSNFVLQTPSQSEIPQVCIWSLADFCLVLTMSWICFMSLASQKMWTRHLFSVHPGVLGRCCTTCRVNPSPSRPRSWSCPTGVSSCQADHLIRLICTSHEQELHQAFINSILKCSSLMDHNILPQDHNAMSCGWAEWTSWRRMLPSRDNSSLCAHSSLQGSAEV